MNPKYDNWRSEYPVLVAEAQTLGSIGVIRSLGRVGYPVHSFSSDPSALGFESRYNGAHIESPNYENPHFIDWLSAYIRTNRIRAIIPSEGLLLAIRPHFHEFSPLLPYSENQDIVFAGMSKADQIATLMGTPAALGTRDHIPRFLLWSDPQSRPNSKDLERLGLPLYIKVDGLYSRDGDSSAVHKTATLDQALETFEKVMVRYRKVLIEGHVPGSGTGAFFLIWDGKVRAEFMHMRLHEVPSTGGVSSYRKSWWHEAIRADALAKLNAMRWQGVAMMEYRWDHTTDEFYFLEMNGRFWGSLHLPLFAGVDFPALLLDLFHGRQRELEKRIQKNVSCRYTFPRDFYYVWSCWKDLSLTWGAKLAVLLEFFALGLDPRVRSDLWFPGDRKLYWIQLWRFLGELFLGLFKKLTGQKVWM